MSFSTPVEDGDDADDADDEDEDDEALHATRDDVIDDKKRGNVRDDVDVKHDDRRGNNDERRKVERRERSMAAWRVGVGGCVWVGGGVRCGVWGFWGECFLSCFFLGVFEGF